MTDLGILAFGIILIIFVSWLPIFIINRKEEEFILNRKEEEKND